MFRTLAPGRDAAPPTQGRAATTGTVEEGYLHCGPAGAGHFVKMVHNGIEYALMAAYAEGFNILAHAGVGAHPRPADAETAPLRAARTLQVRHPRGGCRRALAARQRGRIVAARPDGARVGRAPGPEPFSGHVSDSGEGRWTVGAAIETATPAPVLAAALFHRFSSRGEDDFANRLLSAMRYQFGGHVERPAVRSVGDHPGQNRV